MGGWPHLLERSDEGAIRLADGPLNRNQACPFAEFLGGFLEHGGEVCRDFFMSPLGLAENERWRHAELPRHPPPVVGSHLFETLSAAEKKRELRRESRVARRVHQVVERREGPAILLAHLHGVERDSCCDCRGFQSQR